KPGRDPRPEFKTAAFKEGVERLEDLQPGMLLEGVVTNVANFGAFVDVGVHQDGLVHVSALADRFVKDPRDVVKAGDRVKGRGVEEGGGGGLEGATRRAKEEGAGPGPGPGAVGKNRGAAQSRLAREVDSAVAAGVPAGAVHCVRGCIREGHRGSTIPQIATWS